MRKLIIIACLLLGALCSQGQQTRTQFGFLLSDVPTHPARANIMRRQLYDTIVRAHILMQEYNGFSQVMKTYADSNFRVLLNINGSYKNADTPMPWEDPSYAALMVDSILDDYSPELVVIDNEEDNKFYHTGADSEYIAILDTCIDVVHAHGKKIANAGLTWTALRAWMYHRYQTTFRPEMAFAWKQAYLVPQGLTTTSSLFNTQWQRADYFLNQYAGMAGLDYVNVHIYINNNDTLNAQLFNQIKAEIEGVTGKPIITNEFGLTGNSVTYAKAMFMGAKRGHYTYAVFYSGDSSVGSAYGLIASGSTLNQRGKTVSSFMLSLRNENTYRATDIRADYSLSIGDYLVNSISNDPYLGAQSPLALVTEYAVSKALSMLKYPDGFIPAPRADITITYGSTTDHNVYVERTAADSVDIAINWVVQGDSLTSIVVADSVMSFTQPLPGDSITGILYRRIPSNIDAHYSIVATNKSNQVTTAGANIFFRDMWYAGFLNGTTVVSSDLPLEVSFFSDSLNVEIDISSISGRQYAIIVVPYENDPNNLIRILYGDVDETYLFTRYTTTLTNESGYTDQYIVYFTNTTAESALTLNMDTRRGGGLAYVQDSLLVGISAPISLTQVIGMLQDSANWSDYAAVLRDYKIHLFRSPGGTNADYWFWDDTIAASNIERMASNRISDWYEIIGSQENADDFRDRGEATSGNEFNAILRFCKLGGFTPVVHVNTQLYKQGDTVYFVDLRRGGNGLKDPPIDMGLREDRWDTIEANIAREVLYGHSVFGEDSVMFWEIGNEDGIFIPGPTYAETAIRMVNVIKALYPRDRVLFSFSKGNVRSERADVWNQEVVAYFLANSYLRKLDYANPHYSYPDEGQQSGIVQDSINLRVRDRFLLDDYMAMVRSYFPATQLPKVLLTEISSYPNNTDTNFNKQILALYFYHTMLAAHGDDHVAGYANHGGFGVKNGMFFDAITASGFSYATDPPITPIFPYISPRAEAFRLYHTDLGVETIRHVINDDYEMLETRTGDTTYIKVLNYREGSLNFNVSTYNGTKTYQTNQFDDLTSYYWYPALHETTGSATTTVTIPAHAVATIIIVP